MYCEGALDNPTAADLPMQRLPSFRTPEGCAAGTPVLGRRRSETQHSCRAATLERGVLRDRLRASSVNV